MSNEDLGEEGRVPQRLEHRPPQLAGDVDIADDAVVALESR
jgi:hypothetical protein